MPLLRESRCIHSPENLDICRHLSTTLVRLLTPCCSVVGGTIVPTSSSSWILKHQVHWDLVDPGCASDAFLGPPFLYRVGELPMRHGWTVKGKAFGLSITGAVSVPFDARSALFSCTIKLDTGAICYGTIISLSCAFECVDTVLMCRGTPLDETYITSCRSHGAARRTSAQKSAARRSTKGHCTPR
jgi:hypothetical protein